MRLHFRLRHFLMVLRPHIFNSLSNKVSRISRLHLEIVDFNLKCVIRMVFGAWKWNENLDDFEMEIFRWIFSWCVKFKCMNQKGVWVESTAANFWTIASHQSINDCVTNCAYRLAIACNGLKWLKTPSFFGWQSEQLEVQLNWMRNTLSRPTVNGAPVC